MSMICRDERMQAREVVDALAPGVRFDRLGPLSAIAERVELLVFQAPRPWGELLVDGERAAGLDACASLPWEAFAGWLRDQGERSRAACQFHLGWGFTATRADVARALNPLLIALEESARLRQAALPRASSPSPRL